MSAHIRSTVCLYEDGKKVSTANYKLGIGTNKVDLLIGLDLNTYLNYNKRFKGSIDDVRIYNRALSESEVRQLYNLKE